MPRVTIVGSGFAALTAVHSLRKAAIDTDITLVSPRAELVYYPGLIWVPTGLRTGEDLRLPLDSFFRRMGVEHLAAEATGLRNGGRILESTAGDIANDGLIIGCGGRYMKKLPGIERAIIPCESIGTAQRIRDRLGELDSGTIAMGFAGNPKEPSAMRGGPLFEFLFGIESHLRKQKRRERFKLVFFTPAEKPGNRLGPKAVTGLMDEMRKRDIEAHLGHKIKGFAEGKVLTEGGDIDADLILFMPGMTGSQWLDNAELPRSEGGFVKADGRCRVDGLERVYVAGDSGSFPGPEWLPKQAHMADLQAKAAVANLVAEIKGEQPVETFRSELLCIVDTNDRGILVARNEKHNLVLPSMRMFHWMKRGFEWWYLRHYR
jgi:sulfide:quinone oxidoreductase